MKKSTKTAAGELRAEYKRSDFSGIVRGKYVNRLQVRSNVVMIDPDLTTGVRKARVDMRRARKLGTPGPFEGL